MFKCKYLTHRENELEHVVCISWLIDNYDYDEEFIEVLAMLDYG